MVQHSFQQKIEPTEAKKICQPYHLAADSWYNIGINKMQNEVTVTVIRILFICHGNIYRSPMAEFIMKDLVQKAGLSSRFEIASAATSTEEIGNPVYPPARRKMAEHGIDCSGKTARQLRKADYDHYDLLIGMDQRNISQIRRICGEDPSGKIHRLMDYTNRPGEVADPWYTRDFDTAWEDIREGCEGLLLALKQGGRLC